MSKSSARSVIRLRGVRHNNLKNFDLDLPLNQLIVITGLSGSGKSSLAFDTLFAEGQRRYIETFSPYARQFFDRMDKPQVDSIEGIPPAIAIEQRNSVRTTRSTVGTMTEICDYMKMLWPHVSQLHCRQCGKPVRKDSPQMVWEAVQGEYSAASVRYSDLLITFDLPLTEKLPLAESLALVAKQGYQRVLVNGAVMRLDEVSSGNTLSAIRNTLTVIQDRLKPSPANRARFIEACEQAYHFGKGKLAVFAINAEGSNSKLNVREVKLFSNRLHCADCDIEYKEPSPALFSFNHPVGACPACKGFGRIISIDYNLAMPDRSRTIAQGVVKPWLVGHGLESQTDLLRACRELDIPTDVPFEKLAKKWQTFVIEGDPEYGSDEEHHWPRCWYGVKGYFRWLESKAYKMHVRVLLSRYRAYTMCPTCQGQRFQPDSLLYRLVGNHGFTLAGFYQLPIRDALSTVKSLGEKYKFKSSDPIGLVLHEVGARLNYLVEVGLGYLTLDRPTRSLSGGETERVNLTTCLGTCLVNTLFVLDEPSVGLHPRDTERLVSILQRLRNAGNTVVVVEHEASVMRAADQIVDIGPGHGASGGSIVFQGPYPKILRCKQSLTGQYLSGLKEVEIPERRPVKAGARDVVARSTFEKESEKSARSGAFAAAASRDVSRSALSALELNEAPVPYRINSEPSSSPTLVLSNASKNNLQDVSVEFPLERFVCVTGVSGSGKTTLVREVLLPLLTAKLGSENSEIKASDRMDKNQSGDDSDEEAGEGATTLGTLEGCAHLKSVVLVDQSILGKTPRSNPAVYIGAFDDIREVFAQSELAKQRGLNASAFSFNSAQGQCERCRGAGYEKIEMQFLSDVFIRCPDCSGRRYRSHILEVKIRPPESKARKSIGDLLDSTVEEAIEFLRGFNDSRQAQKAVEALSFLAEVGLGYLKLGQPINTLSGGESQRLKLVRHLAESASSSRITHHGSRLTQPSSPDTRHSTLFLFDEPTTGLHFDDVRVLLKVFQRLVDAGNSIIVIEHNLDVIKSADWIIDLGPDAGDQGGRIVAVGTPEQIAENADSHTGRALADVLEESLYA
jgi:excinuclease ABC subunit A